MLAKILFAIALFCMFLSGLSVGRGWRQWSDDAELDPGAATLAVLLFLLGLAFCFVGPSA